MVRASKQGRILNPYKKKTFTVQKLDVWAVGVIDQADFFFCLSIVQQCSHTTHENGSSFIMYSTQDKGFLYIQCFLPTSVFNVIYREGDVMWYHS